MSERTNIQWCDSTLNFWSGCTKVSPGCVNCYAETLSNRFNAKDADPWHGSRIGHWGKDMPRQIHESAFKLAKKLERRPWICDKCGETALATTSSGEPVQCAAPHTKLDKDGNFVIHVPLGERCACKSFRVREIFSLSLGDWLDPEVEIEWLARMLDTIRRFDQVRWLLLTKRPELWHERMLAVMRWNEDNDGSVEAHKWILDWATGMAPEHVANGVSVENQAMANKRIPELLSIPAHRRFLSLEPLLGPVSIRSVFGHEEERNWIDQIIIGGESGPGARPCNVEWIRSLVKQGQAAGVRVFVKQLGSENYRLSKLAYATLGDEPFRDKKGGDPAEWPEDLRVQERLVW